MKNRITLATLGAAALLVASTAQAQEITPAFATSRAGGFVELWPARDHFAVVHGAELQLKLSPTTFLDLSMSSAYASAHGAGASFESMGFGNPTLGMHFVGATSPDLHLYVGFGITPPLLQDPDEDTSNAAFYGVRIRGYYDADRFVRGHLAARVEGGLEWHIANSPVLMRAEVNPVLFVPTSDKFEAFGSSGERITPGRGGLRSDGARLGLTIESAVEAEVRSNSGFGAGLRLQAVMMPTESDMGQALFEPFVQMTPRRTGLYARLGAPLALDGDLGLGLDRDRLAGLNFTIGGQW